MAAKEHKDRKELLTERGCVQSTSRSTLDISNACGRTNALRLGLRPQLRSFAFCAFFCG
jgi:hypothetical protein